MPGYGLVVYGRRSTWLAYVSIVVLALGAVWPALAADAMAGSTVDLFGTLWFQWWIETCLQTGMDPGFTGLMFHPLGKEIFAHTGNNFVDALIAQPFRWFLPPAQAYNVFVLSVLLGNAWSFERLLRDRVADGAARWAGTALWTLNPFVLFELNNGRPTQAFLWFLPLAIHHFLRIGVGGWRAPVLAGVFTALQAWVYWFLGFFVVISFGCWAVIQWWVSPANQRRNLVRGWVLSGAACLVLVAPFVLPMLASVQAGEVPGLVVGGGGFLDRPQLSGNSVAQGFQGWLFVEQVAQPLFASLVWGGGIGLAVAYRGTRRMWGVLAVVSLAFAVGPVFSMGPGEGVVMPHYMALFHWVPFFSRLWFPYRWIVLAVLAVAVALSLWLRDIRVDGRSPVRRALPFVLVAVAIAEQVGVGAYPLVHRSLTPPAVLKELGTRGGGVVDLPLGMVKPALVWQTAHGQPTFGGMGENAPVLWPNGFQERLLLSLPQKLRQAVRAPQTIESEDGRDKWLLVDEGFRWVVLDRAMIQRRDRGADGQVTLDIDATRARQVTDALSRMLGGPVAVDGRVLIWDLTGGPVFDAPYTPSPERLADLSWATQDAVGVLEPPHRRIHAHKEQK